MHAIVRFGCSPPGFVVVVVGSWEVEVYCLGKLLPRIVGWRLFAKKVLFSTTLVGFSSLALNSNLWFRGFSAHKSRISYRYGWGLCFPLPFALV